MAINSGNAADADEVMNAFGMMFKNQAQTILNTDLNVFNAKLHEEFINLDYDNFTADTVGTKTNLVYDATNDYYTTLFGTDDTNFAVFDDFDDASIDGTKWTTAVSGVGAIVESGTQIWLSSDNSGTSQLTSLNDIFSDTSNYASIKIDSNNADQGAGSGTNTIKLTDGTNNHIIKTHTNSSAATGTIILEKIGNTVYTLYPGDSWQSTDVTAWGASIKVDFLLSKTGGSSGSPSAIKLDWVKYNSNTLNTHILISDVATTSSATITNAILTANDLIDTSPAHTIQYSMSADNGVNFENVTLNEIHRFTNTGTQLKVKAIITSDSSTQNKDQESRIYNYAAQYNLY